MLYRDIFKLLGSYLFVLAALFCVPFSIAFYYQFFSDPATHPQSHSTLFFFETIVITLLLGLFFRWIGKNASGNLYRREGIFVVVLIWFITPALSALPFIFSHTLENPFQAYFEMVSGYTTTGSTTMYPKKYDPQTGEEIPIHQVVKGVIDTGYTFYGTITPIRDPQTGKVLYEGIEAVGKALLFWRSFTQWLGGMGIIVLFVAILPALGIGGKQLFHAEAPGPIKDSLTPRIKDTASALWKIYLGLTVIETVVLMATNSEMPLFDAVTITFSTLATGGFSVKNANIAAYNNATTEWVIILFMLVGGINFSLYYYALRGKLYRLYDPELLIFLVLITLSSVFCAYHLVGWEIQLMTGGREVLDVAKAVRYGFFQVISAQTTTGFVTANVDIWPYTTQVLLLIVMYFAAMAGSTSGGIKTMRLYMLFRIVQNKIESLFRPESVRNFTVGSVYVDHSTVVRNLCFFLIIAAVSTLSTFLFVADGIDPETALGAVACLINNVGVSFRAAGPFDSYAFMSDASLLLSSFIMILGRLEYFAILAILVPAFWKERS